MRDVVDRASLLALVFDDFRDCSRVEFALGLSAGCGCGCLLRTCRVPYQVECGVYFVC